jgi:putative peptide zinc metalloprotease protein
MRSPSEPNRSSFSATPEPEGPASVDLQTYEGFDETCLLDEISQRLNYIISNKNGQQISLSASAFYLLQAFRAGTSFEELAADLSRKLPRERAILPEQLERLYHDIIDQLAAIEKRTPSASLPFGFWLRLRILPQSVVNKLSSWMTFLYWPPIATWILLIIIAAIVSAIYGGLFRIRADSSAFLPSYLLFLLSLAVHEFGHSTACVAFGARASDIGFTIYLIYPAFYSDVTASWRLSRWRRLIVDLGGFYFQFAVGSCFLLVYHFRPWEPLRIAFLVILYTAIISLNPIFKFDGYWALTDLLGVSNLGKQPRRIAKCILDRLRGRETAPVPWPTGIMIALVIYAIAAVWVWAGFLWRVSPLTWSQLLYFLHNCQALWRDFSSLTLPKWREIQNLLISLMQLTIVVAILWRLGHRFVILLRHRFKTARS